MLLAHWLLVTFGWAVTARGQPGWGSGCCEHPVLVHRYIHSVKIHQALCLQSLHCLCMYVLFQYSFIKSFSSVRFSSVQLLSCVWLFATSWLQHISPPCPSPTPGVHSNSRPSSRWYHPAISSSVVPFSSCPQSLPASESFSNESTLHMRWPKYWSFSFSIIPYKEHPGPISFRMDWLDLLAVQGTLKRLLQHHSSKASILQCSAFFIVQLSHPYMTTGTTIALTRQTFVGKVMSLLFNMLSRLVITFFPRSKRLLISWLQSPSAVILEPKKLKSDTVSTVSPSISHEVLGPDTMILVFWMFTKR